MKSIHAGLLALLAVLCMIGMTVADIPDLVGNWSGSSIGYQEGIGLADYPDGTFSITITEQTDRVFTGYILTKDNSGADFHKNMSGVISADGKEIYLAEHGEGISIGTIISPDEFELTYLQSGDSAYAGIDHLVKVK